MRIPFNYLNVREKAFSVCTDRYSEAEEIHLSFGVLSFISVQKSLPLEPLLSQFNPSHILIPHLSNIHFKIIILCAFLPCINFEV